MAGSFPLRSRQVSWHCRTRQLSLQPSGHYRAQAADGFPPLSADVLGILNVPADQPYVIQHVLDAIKRETNADAVGIRIKAGDDFPYFASMVSLMNSCKRKIPWQRVTGTRRSAGIPTATRPSNVPAGWSFTGKTDPDNPLFTPGGSAWTNNSRLLMEMQETEDPRLHPRNTCTHMGYASLSPSFPSGKVRMQIIGTLQINALRKDCFTPGIIQYS